MSGRSKRPPKAELEQAIRDAGGNLTRAASVLGVSRPSVYTWIYQYDLTKLAGVIDRETEQLRLKSAAEGEPVTITTKLPAELHRWVRIRAIEGDQTVADVFADALKLMRALLVAEKGEASGGGR